MAPRYSEIVVTLWVGVLVLSACWTCAVPQMHSGRVDSRLDWLSRRYEDDVRSFVRALWRFGANERTNDRLYRYGLVWPRGLSVGPITGADHRQGLRQRPLHRHSLLQPRRGTARWQRRRRQQPDRCPQPARLGQWDANGVAATEESDSKHMIDNRVSRRSPPYGVDLGNGCKRSAWRSIVITHMQYIIKYNIAVNASN